MVSDSLWHYGPGHSLPGSSVHGILQARILEWVAVPSSRRSSQHRDQAQVSCVFRIGRRVLYHESHLSAEKSKVLVTHIKYPIIELSHCLATSRPEGIPESLDSSPHHPTKAQFLYWVLSNTHLLRYLQFSIVCALTCVVRNKPNFFNSRCYLVGRGLGHWWTSSAPGVEKILFKYLTFLINIYNSKW